MKKIIISLAGAKDRRAFVGEQFEQFGIVHEFFSAIEPQAAAEQLKGMGIPVSCHSNPAQPSISETELACFASHMAVLEAFLAGEDRYVAVFEDDVFLSNASSTYLQNTDWIPPNIGLLRLEKFSDSIDIERRVYQEISGNRHLAKMTGVDFGTAGYIIDRAAAEKLIHHARKSGASRPVDHFYFDRFSERVQPDIWQLMPAICIQANILQKEKGKHILQLESQITRSDFSGITRSSNKLKRELGRIFDQLQTLLQHLVLRLTGARIRLTWK